MAPLSALLLPARVGHPAFDSITDPDATPGLRFALPLEVATMIRTLLLSAAAGVLLALPATTASAEPMTPTCASFASQAAAQAAYRMNPVGLANLDSDHDGLACELNKAPYDWVKVNLGTASVATTSMPRLATIPSAPVTGDGSGQSSNWTPLGLFAAFAVGLMLIAGAFIRRETRA
jgi:hypothetical protein